MMDSILYYTIAMVIVVATLVHRSQIERKGLAYLKYLLLYPGGFALMMAVITRIR